MTENEYARFVYDILDMVDEMKLAGGYDTDTLEEIVWRVS
jgi:hypothetical protein